MDLRRGPLRQPRVLTLKVDAIRTRVGPLQIGLVALGVAMITVIFASGSALTLVAAAVATVALSMDRRLGPIPAALVVVLAIPYARGADVHALTLAGLPARPQDAAILVGILGAVPAVARARWRRGDAFRLAVAVFLIVGIAAAAIGMMVDHGLRDIVRDSRWWELYGAALLASLAGVHRPPLIRGLVFGMIIFGITVILVAVLPAIPGGLKEQALAYDRGSLRMQFGNSVFLIPATAWLASRILGNGRPLLLLPAGLLIMAQVLSLTRMSIVVTAVMLALMLGWSLTARLRRFGRNALTRSRVARVVAVSATVLVSAFLAIEIASYVTPQAGVAPGTSGAPETPVDRITFSDDQSDISSIVGSVRSGGRFATYVAAFHQIASHPVIGGGMGQLVDVAFAYNADRAYTIGKQPGVDNAWLTIGLKAGALGLAAFGAMLGLSLLSLVRRERRQLAVWLLPASISVGVLTMTQSFAVSSYGPWGIGLLLALPFIGYARMSRRAADFHV